MKKIDLFVVVFILSFVLSACASSSQPVVSDNVTKLDDQAVEDLTSTLKTADGTTANDYSSEAGSEALSADVNAEDWLMMERPREKFRVKHPKNWYYVSNYAAAKKAEFEALIGFGDSSEVWEQELPYMIEIVLVKDELYLDMESAEDDYYEAIAAEVDGVKYLIKSDKQYKKIVDLMAASFEIIE